MVLIKSIGLAKRTMCCLNPVYACGERHGMVGECSVFVRACVYLSAHSVSASWLCAVMGGADFW